MNRTTLNDFFILDVFSITKEAKIESKNRCFDNEVSRNDLV